MTAIGCTCEELLIVEARKAEGTVEYTGRVYRLPPPEGHNCWYVQQRNKLIPLAWANAGARAKNAGERSTMFHAEMEKLVRDAYKRGEL